jgi:uncharacterized protein YhjY with autotransporter beta-barrel domain
MELAAHWHRCQNLPKKRVNTSLLYKAKGFMHCSFSFHTVGAAWSAKHLSFKHTPFGVQKQGGDALVRHIDAIPRLIEGENGDS